MVNWYNEVCIVNCRAILAENCQMIKINKTKSYDFDIDFNFNFKSSPLSVEEYGYLQIIYLTNFSKIHRFSPYVLVNACKVKVTKFIKHEYIRIFVNCVGRYFTNIYA